MTCNWSHERLLVSAPHTGQFPTWLRWAVLSSYYVWWSRTPSCLPLYLCQSLAGHLSSATHLALALFHSQGKAFLPMPLIIDIMLMVKNAFFCVAKAKVDNPGSCFWLILLGTDRLEQIFGLLWTMVGNDANLDLLQLVQWLTRVLEIANILAKYPQWDQSPYHLKLPALTCNSKELPDGVDHINPANWCGDVSVDQVTLLPAGDMDSVLWRKVPLI